jgi:Phage Terminase
MLHLRLALAFLLVVVADASSRTRRKPKLQTNTLEHFAEFCRRFIVLDNGKPFELEHFQRLILAGYFAGVTEIVVLLPKKNGKTTLLAALALYHLIYTPNAACYIAASAVPQARILYEQACGFVERKGPDGKLLPQAAALRKRVLLRKGSKEIRSRRDSGFIRVISGDKDTGDGVIPTLALVDELHRHKDDGELYGVLADGLGPRDGQIITISTAGESLKSALGKLWKKARKLGAKRDGAYVHVRSPNGEFELHEWSLEPNDDRENLKIVKQANPLSVNTIEKLEQRKASPSMRPSRWARFACGVWMRGDDAAISAVDWERNGRDGVELRGKAGYIALDIAWKWDTTAVVAGVPHDREELVIDDEEGWWRWRQVRYGKPRILHPPRNGDTLDFDKVIAAVLAFREEDGMEILGVVIDRNADAERVAQVLEKEHGLEIIEHSQAPDMMADSSMGFAEAVGHDLIEHPNDDEFSEHVLAGIEKPAGGEKWRFYAPDKNRGQRKKGKQEREDVEYVDAGTAAVMLHRVATAPRQPEIDPSLYRIELV